MNAPIETFFLVTQPDSEELAIQELLSWASPESICKLKLSHGGVEFEAPVHLGFALNYVLKIPSRILMRLESFKCREFKKLEQKLFHINWGNYAGTGVVNFQVSSNASRLFHKRNIQEVAKTAFEKYRVGQPASKKDSNHEQTFYIKLFEDICQVSVDTSGEHLHKRGYKKLTSEAPLRETIASTIIKKFLNETNINPKDYFLVDPFCGSGTILGEAHFLLQSHQNHRPYAFENFKLYRKILKRHDFQSKSDSLFKGYYGFDKDSKSIQAAKENLSPIENANIIQKDVLDYSQAEHPCVVLTNPPYGERIEGIDLEKALGFIEKNYSPDFIGLYLAKSQGRILNPNYKLISRYSLKNTKIPAQLLIYQKNR